MGQQGTEVARGAAAMILTDDHFATIAAAVEEGRGIHDNLVKFMAWSLPTNGGEGVVLLAAILTSTTLPVLPVQLLWINLVTAVLLGTALILEPHEPGLMDRPPRPASAPLIDRALATRTALVSLVVGGAAFIMFRIAQAQGLSVEACRTVAMNGIVVVEVGYLFACRSLRLPAHKLSWRPGNPTLWIGATLMLLIQLLVTYTPWAQQLLHTASIAPSWWAVFTGAGLLIFLAAEARKLWLLRGKG